jgi:hypothetical protein
MSLEKSQKIIKVFGILSIISAILALLGGLAMLGIGGIGAATAGETPDQELAMGIGVALFAGIAARRSRCGSFRSSPWYSPRSRSSPALKTARRRSSPRCSRLPSTASFST